MRAFIALDIPDEIKKKIAQIVSSLYSLPAKIKWVETKNLHLTIKFIPQIDTSTVNALKERLEPIVAKTTRTYLTAKDISFLSHKGDIRLIYLKLEENQVVQEIVQKIELTAFSLTGIKEKRKPLLHITLGRIKHTYEKKKLKQILHSYQFNPFKWEVKEITFFQSTLTPTGPIYQPLFKIKLARKGPD